MASVPFSDTEMRCAYLASERGAVLIRESADGSFTNHKYRIVDARVVSSNSLIAAVKSFCRAVNPSLVNQKE